MFSGVELAILYAVRILYKYFSAEQIEQEPPIALKRRLRLLKKIAENSPAVSLQKVQILTFCQNVTKEAEFRHDLIHGQNYRVYIIKPEEEFYGLMARPESVHDILSVKGTRVTVTLLKDKYESLRAMRLSLAQINRALITIGEADAAKLR